MKHSLTVAAAAVLALGLASAAHAQRVARDAQGGDLRAPTAVEATALQQTNARTGAIGLVSGKADPQPVRLANGTVMQELTADSMMYSVARRNADGTISQFCVKGEEAAERLVKSEPFAKPAAFAKAPVAAKGQVYEDK